MEAQHGAAGGLIRCAESEPKLRRLPLWKENCGFDSRPPFGAVV